jgi:Fungal specific transcription factor domain
MMYPGQDLPLPLATPLSFDVEDFALTFFLGTYISGSRWDYVPTLFDSTTSPDAPFNLSVKASALASLSQELESWEIASIGRKYYARALKSTNEALACKSQAVQNETLASILVLSLFESINQIDEMSRSSWEAHINGAAALLKLRGQEQFETKLGRLLFLHATDSIRISCVQHCILVPEYLQSINYTALTNIDGVVVDISNLTTRMVNLRARMVTSAALEPYALIEEISQLQDELPRLKSRLPDHVSYTVCHTRTSDPNIWGQKYLIYKTHRNMRLWNTLRMVQVWITVSLWRLTSYVVTYNIPEPADLAVDIDFIREISVERMLIAADDICASVPYVMGDIKPPDGVLPSRFASSLSLIWPLSLIGESTLVSVEMRNYAIEQLRRIGHRNKIPQATRTADSIARFEKNKIWSVSLLHAYDLQLMTFPF